MTPEQRKAIQAAKAFAHHHGRRPMADDLYADGIAFGRKRAFLTLHALLIAADLATPAEGGRAGLTEAEDRVFLRMWESGSTQRDIARALGVNVLAIHLEVTDRRLTRRVGRKSKDELILSRRCQNPACGQITEGAGPCHHCGADGLTSAA